MDTEEDNKIQLAIRAGRPETDEGPYYHTSWWESYKGGVKGKLGGAVIGAVIGAVLGIAAVGIMAVAGGIAWGLGAAVIGTLATGGMMYGAHEFGDVGKVTGAVAAAHENSEARMKSFENGKFAEIKNDINDLKRMIGGKRAVSRPAPVYAAAAPAENHSEHYRTQHCDDGHCPPEKTKWIFWKVALIGLVVGIAAGALLAFGGGTEHILGIIGNEAVKNLTKTNIAAASMATMGLFGASFGINRDIFRKIFDKTDRLFRGLPANGKSPSQGLSQAQEPILYKEQAAETPGPAINTVVYDNFPDYPQSDTYHRDRVLSSAKQALLSMDHTKSIPH